jgi:HemY protein
MQGETALALETLRLLVKHNAVAKPNGLSLLRALALELIFASRLPSEITQAWSALDPTERAMPEVALGAARHWLALGGDAAQSRAWLLPVWALMVEKPTPLTPAQRLALVRTLESGLGAQNDTPEAAWLSRIEAAQMSDPRDALLQYLAGVMCARLGLWGKAQHLLRQSAALSTDLELKRDAQRALDAMAHRGN